MENEKTYPVNHGFGVKSGFGDNNYHMVHHGNGLPPELFSGWQLGIDVGPDEEELTRLIETLGQEGFEDKLDADYDSSGSRTTETIVVNLHIFKVDPTGESYKAKIRDHSDAIEFALAWTAYEYENAKVMAVQIINETDGSKSEIRSVSCDEYRRRWDIIWHEETSGFNWPQV